MLTKNLLLSVGSAHLEAALVALLAAKVKFDQRLHALDNLATVAGFNNDVPHTNVQKNIRRGLAHRIGYIDTWLPTNAKKLFSMPLNDLVRHVLNNGTVVEDRIKQAS